MRFPIDTYSDNLMLPVAELEAKKVEPQVIQRIVRLRDIYNYMLRNPLMKDRQYLDYIQANYKDEDGKPISKRKAYEDIEILHTVVGNLQMCSKEWHRWRMNNMIAEGYAIALRKEDAAAIAKLASTYGKFNNLDKKDERDAGYEKMPRINFTFDVSKMGYKAIENAYSVIDEVIAKYSGKQAYEIAEDAEVVELLDGATKPNANGDARPVS